MKIAQATAVVAILFVCLSFARAEPNTIPAEDRTLIVGTKPATPFSIKSEDGTWSGISIDLWKHIASEFDLSFKFRETDLKGLLDGIQNGDLDVSVAALTITAEREHFGDCVF